MIIRKNLNPKQEKTYMIMKNIPITDIKICRKPISSMINKILNVISFGKFEENLKNSPYDKLFHLSLYITLKTGYKYILEKNQRINLYVDMNYINNDIEYLDVDINNKEITLKDLFEKTINNIGIENFYVYKSHSWNCQNFIYNILLNNHLMNQIYKEFILQNTEYLFNKLGYLKYISDKLTDTVANLDIIYNGGGKKDIINNWYDKLKDKKDDDLYNKKPIGYEKHYILNNSHTLAIGGTGCGKSNCLTEYLYRCNGNFYDIIIFTALQDEFLYKKLQEKSPSITIINDINDLIDCRQYDYSIVDKNPKLLIIDDFININKKEIKKIKDYLIFGRKMGWTCYLQSQNYTQVDKTILRNINYFIIYKLNDNITINNIIRNHNIDNTKKNIILNMYNYSTKEKFNFFMIDLKNEDNKYRYRKNFLEFLQPNNFNNK